MIVHRSCHTQLYLNLSPAYKFYATYGITSRGLRTNICEIIQVGTNGPTMFFCGECKQDVPLTDAVVQCLMCGEYHEISESWRATSAGGLYCDRCAHEYYPNDIERLNVRQFNITGSRRS